MKKEVAGILFIAVIAYLMALVVMEMPGFGEADSPAAKKAASHYLKRGVEETGSLDIVTAIVLDYRAYDTLFEATLLYTAALSVRVVLGSKEKIEKGGGNGGSDSKKG